MATRRFRFGVQAHDAPDRQTWAELARKVEDLGFDLLVTPDHLDQCLSPLVPLITAAEATQRLRVGTLVLNNDFRHPAVLAREAATIDLMTDGRFELGLGAGHARPEYDHIGIPFDPAPVRVRRLRESVEVLRRLLDGERVDFTGEHYRLRGEQCHPRSRQPHLPLLVGGGGRHVLATAARFADAVGFTGLGRTLPDGNRHEPSGFTPAAVDTQVAWVRERAGTRLDDLECQVLVQAVDVASDPRAAAEKAQQRMPSLSIDDLLDTPYVLIGTHDSLVDRLIAYRDRWGFSHWTIRTDAMDLFAPVVAALAGT